MSEPNRIIPWTCRGHIEMCDVVFTEKLAKVLCVSPGRGSAMTRLSEAQRRLLERSLGFAKRIVVGQLGVGHRQAAFMVNCGFWERSELEMCKGRMTWRYRLTDRGRAALATKEPTDAQ